MSERPSSKWIEFLRVPKPPKYRTSVHRVVTKDSRELGLVRWYAQWRRYWFVPSPMAIAGFDAQCLRDIAAFCDWLMAERKGAKR